MIQFSVALRNARLDVIESVVGVSPKLQLRTGVKPADCAAAASGTLIAEVPCPSDWMASAAAGQKVLAGTWTVAAIAAGTVGHFRLLDGGGVCHEQGTATLTGAGGDMTLDNTAATVGQVVTITTWTKTEGNA